MVHNRDGVVSMKLNNLPSLSDRLNLANNPMSSSHCLVYPIRLMGIIQLARWTSSGIYTCACTHVRIVYSGGRYVVRETDKQPT